MKKLGRAFWCAISACKEDDSPAVIGGACLYGMPLHKQASDQIDAAVEKAAADALQYGLGNFKVQHVPHDETFHPELVIQLPTFDPEFLNREVRMFKTKHPVSGIPTDDAERKRYQAWTFLTGYFPDSFLAVVEVAIAGNEQHNPGQPLHWARGKSKDQLNSGFKHLFEYGRGVKRDTDGQYHLAKAIWRLSAQLQLDIESDKSEQK